MGAHNSHRAVGIGWNEWSASIGTRGRHPLERVVDFSGIRSVSGGTCRSRSRRPVKCCLRGATATHSFGGTPMVSYKQFRRMANRLVRRIPAEFLKDLNGGIIALEEAEQRDPDLPDVYILGEYIEDPYGLGRQIVLYYGSFRKLFADEPVEVWEKELWETILHEIRHHIESLAGVDDLEIEDMRQLAEFRRWAAEQGYRGDEDEGEDV